MAATAVVCSFWRHFQGHPWLPGIFTVVFLPLGALGFVAADRYVHYPWGAWVGVTALIVGHLVFSVPTPTDTIYDVHLFSSPLRVDHAVHFYAGGLVAVLGSRLVVRRWGSRAGPAPLTLGLLGAVLAVALGGMKVLTDVLSVGFQSDNVADLTWNAVGALVVMIAWAPTLRRWSR